MKKKAGAIKAIWIEWRRPTTKAEKSVFGLTTYTNENTARVFINTALNKSSRESVKTYWHELFHVFCNFHGRRLDAKREEDMARRLEAVIWELIR